MPPSFSIGVYCGSSAGTDPEFGEVARCVGHWIGSHQGQLVYGGGKSGLMGILAGATLDAGGTVIGVIPEALVAREWANTACTELHIVKTMHDRKRMMAERADAFLALPGGIGTLEELFEVWTWRQLGYHDKPIGILNTRHYYSGLFAFLASAVKNQFLSEWQMGLVTTDLLPIPLLEKLVERAGLSAAPGVSSI